ARGIAVTLAAPPPALDELDELLEVAVRDGVTLAVDHAPRRSPAVRTLRACVDAGLVGDVTAVWCRHLAADGEAVTRDQLASDVDVLHWLARGTTESCGAVGSAPGPAGREGGEPQVSAIAFTLDNGVSAGYLRGWGAGPGRRFYTVVGTAGRLEGDGDDVRFIRAGVPNRRDLCPCPRPSRCRTRRRPPRTRPLGPGGAGHAGGGPGGLALAAA
ncbi:hypothetical protein GA0115246_112331, partial [Streptomyces sp. SolWspMP-sol7th]